MNYEGKKILVLGLGRSGFAAARLLRQVGAMVTVHESAIGTKLQERARLLELEGITVLLGSSTKSDDVSYALAILSPGIEERTSLVQNVIQRGIPLIGELELAASFCKVPIVAITGTNGKTTTTELIAQILKGGGLRAVACGNIGLPFSEVMMDHAIALDVVVVEVSSFQLERIEKFHPHVAVWLNLSPNHLDRYPSMKEYREAKLNIFGHQTKDDLAVIPKNFKEDISLQARVVSFSSTETGGDFSFENNQIIYHAKSLVDMKSLRLRGAHNAENLMAAFAVAHFFNIPFARMIDAIKDYTPPAHRCELVAAHAGIEWINDSKATTLDAMEKALHSVEKNRPIILIAGGKNKGSSFLSILPLVQERVKKVILIGELRDAIAQEWKGVPCCKVDSIEEAVLVAGASAQAGETIILSPGTSSYDMFNDYTERGDAFKNAVRHLLSSSETTLGLFGSKLLVP